MLKRVTSTDPLARANELRDAVQAVAAEREATLGDDLRAEASSCVKIKDPVARTNPCLISHRSAPCGPAGPTR